MIGAVMIGGVMIGGVPLYNYHGSPVPHRSVVRFHNERSPSLPAAQGGHVLPEGTVVCWQHPRGREEVILIPIHPLHPDEE